MCISLSLSIYIYIYLSIYIYIYIYIYLSVVLEANDSSHPGGSGLGRSGAESGADVNKYDIIISRRSIHKLCKLLHVH